MKTKLLPSIILTTMIAGIVVAFVALQTKKPANRFQNTQAENISTLGVCPPFYLLTEEGDTIDPIGGVNTDKPYSPKLTCGKCHDYELITQGFHFQQGKDELPLEEQTERMQWVSSPGNYGGPWCSPAPLYRYLSDKNNDAASTVDMTSFDFVVSCGVCHPGGGSLEFDRKGLRYDEVMGDETYGFTSGGINNMDGDYYKARWKESGVIEADCYLCHLPEYSNTERVKQIKLLNFQWAATAASGIGEVNGSIIQDEPVTVTYNKEWFNSDGTIEPHIVREPRNETCLWCHAKPGWKKRGANFRSRTDVHLRAGLKCVDCHPGGMSAPNELISGKEVHQFGKGDDPGGHVRDDLDNTMRTCNDCHNSGYLGAPSAKHTWLPPLHLEKIACQTCHIPERSVKSAHYVAGDVFNPGTKIPSKGKHLWTFYDPDMKYWNHYGDLEMMGYDDKPTFAFRPELVNYKDMIYPVNRVHTTWPAIQTDGKDGLMQPKMGDIYKMWTAHFNDPDTYPDLSRISDDNGDEVIEVNTPEEIEALISSVTQMLTDIQYPMEGKRVVWVMNNRIYHTGADYIKIPMEPWEASPYGNVHTYNHDIFPASSALGINGCTDCHSYESEFFMSQVVNYPFDTSGNVVTTSQYKNLGISALQAHTGMLRESYLKPVLYLLLMVFLLLTIIAGFRYISKGMISLKWLNLLSGLLFLVLAFMIAWMLPDSQLSLYMLPSRFQLDTNHFIIGFVVLVVSAFMLTYRIKNIQNITNIPEVLKNGLNLFVIAALVIAGISGFLMLVKAGWVFYSIFDLGLVLATTGSVLILSEFIFHSKTLQKSQL